MTRADDGELTRAQRRVLEVLAHGPADELVVVLIPWARSLAADVDLSDALVVGERDRRGA